MGGSCDQCGHPFDPHVLASVLNPPTSGMIFCPEEGCNCEATWSAQGIDPPTDEECDEVRRQWKAYGA